MASYINLAEVPRLAAWATATPNFPVAVGQVAACVTIK